MTAQFNMFDMFKMFNDQQNFFNNNFGMGELNEMMTKIYENNSKSFANLVKLSQDSFNQMSQMTKNFANSDHENMIQNSVEYVQKLSENLKNASIEIIENCHKANNEILNMTHKAKKHTATKKSA